MKLHKLLLLMIAGFLVSCSNDDDVSGPIIPSGDYANGVFVLNEGGVGEVTFASNDFNTITHDIFAAVNGNQVDLGSFLQSVFFDGDRAFIISNGSNKVTVVNRYTFEFIATISSGFTVPRFGVVSNGKAYVTNSNSFASDTDDFISVIDLTTLAVTSTIPVNDQAERLVEHNGKLYVSGGFYGSGNKVIIVDINSNQVQTKIEVAEAPNSLEMVGGTLYVLSSSYAGQSTLTKISVNDNVVTSTLTFPESMNGAQNLDLDDNHIFFTVGPKIYRFATTVSAITDSPLVDTQSTSAYIGYGFAVKANRIFIAEAAEDFASDGKAFVYDLNGNLVKSFATGLGPNGFYFN